MDTLKAGDRVLSINGQGKAFYDQVLFFGHKDTDSWGAVLDITMNDGASNATRRLKLTKTHYLPVGHDLSALVHKYAKDVAVGDTLWAQASDDKSQPLAAVVTSKGTVYAQGLFNPYTAVSSCSLHNRTRTQEIHQVAACAQLCLSSVDLTAVGGL